MTTKDIPISEIIYLTRRAYCDCGGELIHVTDAVTLLTNPPKYPHRCAECKLIEYIVGEHYPRTIIQGKE